MSQATDPCADGLPADSAGQPWKGRSFETNPHAGDDGSVSPKLAEALRLFREGSRDQDAVVDALREARLLIPLVAELGESGHNDKGQLVDKSQELSIVTVAGPDGRSVLPVFSCVATMQQWNPLARPVPAEGVRVAIAAVHEGTELVVLDPVSESEFAVRRPAVWAMAQGEEWLPSPADPQVLAAFETSIASELLAHAVTLGAGDPQARLQGPELVVRLELAAGLSQLELDAVLARLAARWAADDVIATRVDSLAVQLVASPAD